MEKTDVNGPNAHPAFTWLRKDARKLSGADLSWNFCKFLLTKDGKVYDYYPHHYDPKWIKNDIERLCTVPEAAKDEL